MEIDGMTSVLQLNGTKVLFFSQHKMVNQKAAIVFTVSDLLDSM